jgi:plasmid replication initiation protein
MENFSDVLLRFRNKFAAAEAARPENTQEEDDSREKRHTGSRRLPDRHPNRDFFVADILDWALKDDRHSMEHPMFSLSKKRDHRVRRYEHNGNSVTIKPGADGLATIWDKDVLIYAVSQLVEGINQHREPNRVLRMTAYDLLVSTNRHTGGGDYEQLTDAFRRLSGTRIETNIVTNGERIKNGFGLIDEWRVIEKHPANGRMVAIELTLSRWLYNAVLAREVLTLNRDYFRLGGALERRLYELARKHCGQQAKWTIGTELLHKKSGSSDLLKRFRAAVKRLVLTDNLPEYRMRYDAESDQVMFYTKDAEKLAARLAAAMTKSRVFSDHTTGF